VEKLGYDAMMGIDYHFLNKAHNESKKIYDIESMEMQFELLGGFSDKLQILLLEESVESYNTKEEYKKSLEALAVAWSTGNEAEFERLNSETSFSNEEEKKLYNEYSSKMVTERNINMANYAEDALSSGEEVFICVGAAHVIGDGAMADLLEERGYTIEVIKG